MDFEDVLKDVGGFGKYQKLLILFFTIPTLTVVPMACLNSMFYASSPDHWCNVPEVVASNLSLELQQLLIRPPQDRSCSMYAVDYDAILEKGNFSVDSAWPTKECDKGWQYDTSKYDDTSVTRWNMVCKDDYYNSMAVSAFFFGNVLGTPLIGYFVDKWGRRPIFFFVSVLSGITNLGSVLSPYFSLFIILRAINGTSMTMMYTSGFITLLELVNPDKRARINGIASTSWTLGLCILPLVAYLTRSWVFLSIVTAIMTECLLLYWKFLPESPSWLISRERYEDAAKVMENISKVNGKKAHEGDKILQEIKLLGEKLKKQKLKEESHSPLDFFRNPLLRKRFILITVCWMGNAIPYFGIQLNVSHVSGNEFLNFFLVSLVEVPAHFFTWIFLERVGRRWCSVGAFFLSGIACLLPVLLPDGLDWVGVVSSLLAKGATSSSFMTLYQQAPELYPTCVRGVGLGMSSTIGVGSTLFVPYIIYLDRYGSYIPFLIFAAISFFAAFCATFLPETLNKKLPQTVHDAENFQKNFKFFSCSAEEDESNAEPSLFTINGTNSYVKGKSSHDVTLTKLQVKAIGIQPVPNSPMVQHL